MRRTFRQWSVLYIAVQVGLVTAAVGAGSAGNANDSTGIGASVPAADVAAEWGLSLNVKDPGSFAGLSRVNGELSNLMAGRTPAAEAAGVKMELQGEDNYYELRQENGTLFGNAFVSRRSVPKNSLNEGKDGQHLKLSLDRKKYAPDLNGSGLSLAVGEASGRELYPAALAAEAVTVDFFHQGEKALKIQSGSVVGSMSGTGVDASVAGKTGVSGPEQPAAVFSDHFNTGGTEFQCLPAVFDNVRCSQVVLYTSDPGHVIKTVDPLPNVFRSGKRIRFGIHLAGERIKMDENSRFRIGFKTAGYDPAMAEFLQGIDLSKKQGFQISIPASALQEIFGSDWYVVDMELTDKMLAFPTPSGLDDRWLAASEQMSIEFDYQFSGSAEGLRIYLSPILVYDGKSLADSVALTGSQPAAGSTECPVYREMYLDFSCPMDLFNLKDQIGLFDAEGKPVSISFGYRRGEAPGRLYLKAGEMLKYDSTYTLRIKNDGTLKDIFGRGYRGGITEIPFITVARKAGPGGVLWTSEQVERVKEMAKTQPVAADFLAECKASADLLATSWSPQFHEYFKPSATGWTRGKIPNYEADTKTFAALFSPDLYRFVSQIDGTPYAGELSQDNKAHYRNQWHYQMRMMLPACAVAWQTTRDMRYAKAMYDLLSQYTNCLVSGDSWFTNAYNYKPGLAFASDPAERSSVGNFIGMDVYAQAVGGAWDMIRDSGLITARDEREMTRVWKGMIRHVLDFQFHSPYATHNRIFHSANTLMTCFGVMPPEELPKFTAWVSINRPGATPREVNFDYLLEAATAVAKNNMMNVCDSDGVCREGPGYYHFTMSGAIKCGLSFINDPNRLGLENVINWTDPVSGGSLRKVVSTMGQWGYPNGVPFSDDNGMFKTAGNSWRPDLAEALVAVAPEGDEYRTRLLQQLHDYYRTSGTSRAVSVDNLPLLLPELPEVSGQVAAKPLVWDVEASGVIAKTGQQPEATMVRIDSGTFEGKSDLDALALNYYSGGKIWVSSCGSVLYAKNSRQPTVRDNAIPAKFFQSTAMQNVVVLDGKTYTQGNGDGRYYVRAGRPNTTLVAAQGKRFKFYKGENGYYKIGGLIPNLETYSRGGVLTEDYLLDQFHVKTSGSKVVKDHQMFYVVDTMTATCPDGSAIAWRPFPDMESATDDPNSPYEFHRDVCRADHFSGDLQLVMQDGDHCLRVTYLDLKDVTLFWVKKAPNNELGVPGKDGWWNRLIVRSRDDDVKFTMLFEPKKASDPEFGVRTLTSKKGGFYKVEMTGDRNLVDVIKLP